MLQINLLPPQAKQNLRYANAARITFALGAGAIAVVVTCLILLLPSIFAIAFQKSEVIRALETERKSQEQAGIADMIAEFREVNRNAATAVREAGRGSVHAAFLEAIVRAATGGIRLESVRIRPEAREISIAGWAPTRRDLLAFIEKLRAHPRITSVSSPVQNLVRQTDILFTVAVTMQ